MSPVDRDARLRVPDDVVFREVGDESMILHLGSGIYFGLDDVGTRAWQLLVDRRSVSAAAAVMADEFDADRATIESDVAALADALLARHLLEPDPS